MTVSHLSDTREKSALEWATNKFREFARELTPEGSYWASYNPDFVDLYDTLRNEDPKKLDAVMAAQFRASFTRGTQGEAAKCEIADLIAALIERSEPLSRPLKNWLVKFLRRDDIFYPPKKRGRNSQDLQHRDEIIGETIEYIVDEWNFPATRNIATSRPSAASIVRDALVAGAQVELTEAAVNKIWRETGGLHT